ncbi:MAG: hypothetical protein VB861_11350, partial [Planctomycetaceae bacterium]
MRTIMDKLQPVITHKFWILFVTVFGVAMFGWRSGTGALTEGIDGEKKRLEGSFQKIEGLVSEAGKKNNVWIDELTKINSSMSNRTRDAANQLWNGQKQLKVWPERIRRRASQFFCLEDVDTVLSDLDPQHDPNVIRTFYKLDYERELDRVWLLIEPEQARQGPRKVRFPRQDLPTPQRYPWASVDPSIEEIYSAQEDLWLMSSLLRAIREVNAGTVSVVDSHVKELQLIQLFRGTRLADGAGGGDGTEGGAAGGAGGGDPGMSAGGAGGIAGGGPPMRGPVGVSTGGMGGAMGGAMGGIDGGGVAGDNLFSVPVDFDLSEEFSAVVIAGGQGNRGGVGGEMAGMMGGSMGGGGPMGGGPMGGGGP